MKKAIKKLKPLFLVLVTIVLSLHSVSCEKEEFETLNETSKNQSNYQIKKISFSELKLNRKAFEKLKESRLKISLTYLQRGVYNEGFDVFIDTTNILITEKDGMHSITFRIINDEELSKVENLVLNSKDDGSYKAFITEYLLSQEELTKLANNEAIGDKSPTAITDVSNYSRFTITGNGADCVSMLNYTVGYCENVYGQTIVDNGSNGGPVGTTCVGGWYEVEYQILVIDEGCLSSGGGSSDGSDSGYIPGDGSGDGSWSGGGSPTDSDSGNPNPENPNSSIGNNGSISNPSFTLEDDTPFITTPILTIDRIEVRLYNLLNTTQQTWWNNASKQTKNAILNYYRQNSPTVVVNEEVFTFIEELIDRANQNPTIYTSERIINWFFTPNEGVDFEYDEDFWENPNLTFPSQDLPTWADYSIGYPTETGADNVYGSVGGQVWQTRLQYPNGTTNTCALKVSIALNNCDISIPNIPGQTLQGMESFIF